MWLGSEKNRQMEVWLMGLRERGSRIQHHTFSWEIPSLPTSVVCQIKIAFYKVKTGKFGSVRQPAGWCLQPLRAGWHWDRSYLIFMCLDRGHLTCLHTRHIITTGCPRHEWDDWFRGKPHSLEATARGGFLGFLKLWSHIVDTYVEAAGSSPCGCISCMHGSTDVIRYNHRRRHAWKLSQVGFH